MPSPRPVVTTLDAVAAEGGRGDLLARRHEPHPATRRASHRSSVLTTTLSRRRYAAIATAIAIVATACTPRTSTIDEGRGADLLITGGTVVDGTGAPAFAADLLVHDGRIVRVSRARLARTSAARVVDARGRVIAPGFVDLHVHAERLLRLPQAENYVRQGVTTVVANPDGGWLPHRPSPWPLRPYLDSVAHAPLAVNVAFLVGHNTVRRQVLGMSDRAPTSDELARMRALVAQAMGAGAVGLSTGLNYVPGIYASTDEIVALAGVAADSGGIYTSHIRDEGPRLLESIAEAIEVGRRAHIRVVVDHHKALGARAWGASVRSLAMLDSARAAGVDVLSNQYPYTAASTSVTAMVPAWALAGGDSAVARRLADATLRDSVMRGIVAYLESFAGGDLRRVQLARAGWQRALEGKTLHEWATERGLPPSPATGATLVLEAMQHGGATAIYHFMADDDVERIMRHPATMIASDGELTFPGDAQLHPRSYGTFPRVLGRYVREKGVLTLEEAVKKMTSMPAAALGLADRGRIAPGLAADLVVLDPTTVLDRGTFTDPHQYPTGLDVVIVNGVVTVEGGRLSAARGGRPVLRPSAMRAGGAR